MSLYISIFIVLVCAFGVTCQPLTAAEYAEAFQNYQAAFGKSYTTEQADVAFQNFKANLDGNINTGASLDGIAFDPATVQVGVHAYFDESASAFIAARAGAVAPPSPVVAAAVLSTGAIVGIAVAAALVVAGVIAGAVIYKRRKIEEPKKQQLREEKSIDMIPSPSQAKIEGIDIYQPKSSRQGHQSITGRAPPQYEL